MKNSKAKYYFFSKYKSSAVLRFKLYLKVACFTFLSIRLLSSITSTVYAGPVADNSSKLSQDGFSASKDPKNISSLELLRAGFSVAKAEKGTKSRDQLRKIIQQIRSVELEPQEQTPEPVVVPEKNAVVEPGETAADVPVLPEETEQVTESRLPYKPIADKTLKMLSILAKDPEKLDNPFELGEVVFVSGNLKQAAVFYSEALKRIDPNDVSLSRDRAWIMFQIGNCLRYDDPSASAKMYQRLLTEYPNSPWVDMAKAQRDLIAWHLRDEPARLIIQVKNPGTKKDNIR